MKFQFSENLRNKLVRRFQVLLFIQYVVAAGVFFYLIFYVFKETKFVYRLPFILAVFGLIPAWRYFVEKYILAINRKWEVSDTELKVIVNDTIKFKVDLTHIGTIKEIKGGHLVNHRGNSFIIPDGIENKIQLIDMLSQHQITKTI